MPSSTSFAQILKANTPISLSYGCICLGLSQPRVQLQPGCVHEREVKPTQRPQAPTTYGALPRQDKLFAPTLCSWREQEHCGRVFYSAAQSYCRGSGRAVPFSGEIELGECRVNGRRKGARGREAAGKAPALGLLKRGGKLCTACPHAQRPIVPPTIERMFWPTASFTRTL